MLMTIMFYYIVEVLAMSLLVLNYWRQAIEAVSHLVDCISLSTKAQQPNHTMRTELALSKRIR